MKPVVRRALLSIVAVATCGATALGLTAAGQQLRVVNAAAPVKIKSPAPLAVTGFAPGDSAQRVIVVRNQGRSALRSLRFELDEKRTWTLGSPVAAPPGRATPAGYRWERVCKTVKRKGRRPARRCTTTLRPVPSPLLTDAQGLQVRLDTCSKPWKKLPTAAPTYRCAGKTVTVLASRRLPIRATLRRFAKVPPRGQLHVRMTVMLPAGAGNNLQGRAVALRPTFVTGSAR